MRVRLNTERVVGFGGIQRQGDTVDVGPDEGRRLVATGQAEPVDVETAVAAGPPKTAVRRGRVPKRPGA